MVMSLASEEQDRKALCVYHVESVNISTFKH